MRILKPSLGNTNTSFNATDSLSTDTGNSNGNSLQQAYGRASSGTLTKGSNAPTSSSTEYDDALAQLARQGNYDAYWKKATQNANINRLAQKYVGNTLKQQGLESTGEGTLGSTSLSNAYINAQANALSDFNTQEQAIGENAYTRYQNQQSESASKVSSYESNMSTAFNNNTLEDWYTKNVVNNSDLTDTEKAELARYYEAINSGTSDSFLKNAGISTDYSGYTSADDLKQMTDNGTKTGSKLSSEIDAMVNWVTGNKPGTGTLFKLANSDGSANAYIYYDPSSGSYYRVSEEQASKYTGATYYAYKGSVTSYDSYSKSLSDRANSNAMEEMTAKTAEYYGFPSNAKEGDTYVYGGRTFTYRYSRYGVGEWVRND